MVRTDVVLFDSKSPNMFVVLVAVVSNVYFRRSRRSFWFGFVGESVTPVRAPAPKFLRSVSSSFLNIPWKQGFVCSTNVDSCSYCITISYVYMKKSRLFVFGECSACGKHDRSFLLVSDLNILTVILLNSYGRRSRTNSQVSMSMLLRMVIMRERMCVCVCAVSVSLSLALSCHFNFFLLFMFMSG